jgi:hypothetical protein
METTGGRLNGAPHETAGSPLPPLQSRTAARRDMAQRRMPIL